MPQKIGVMGCGNVASYGHIPAILSTEGLALHALYEPNPARLAEMLERFHPAHATSDAEAFFATGLDGILVTSPAPFHEANVLAAARHGLPVLCEKPLAMNHAQGLRMIEAMQRARDGDGAPLYVAFCYRFSAAALRIKQLIDEDAIGRPRTLRLIYNWDCHGKFDHRDPARGLAPHRDGRMREGGPLIDCGTHQIDLAQWWTASPVVRCTGHGSWADDYDAPDHTWAHLDHQSGAHTAVEVSYSFGHTAAQPVSAFRYEVIGTDGVIVYDRNASHFELRNAQGTFPQQYFEEKDFAGLHHAFAKALHTGQPGNLPTAAEGLRVTELAAEATQQAIAHRSGSRS